MTQVMMSETNMFSFLKKLFGFGLWITVKTVRIHHPNVCPSGSTEPNQRWKLISTMLQYNDRGDISGYREWELQEKTKC